MRLRNALLALSLAVACDDGGDATNTGAATDGTGTTASPPTADGNSGGSTPTSTSAPATSSADATATTTDEPNETGTGPDTMLARFSTEDTWQSTLVSIGPMGELRGNIADELMAWGW